MIHTLTQNDTHKHTQYHSNTMTRTHNDPKTRQKDNLSVFNIINNCFNTFDLNLQSIRTVAKIDTSSITRLITLLIRNMS